MLNKLFLRAAATAVTMTFAAGPASADNFQILMMDYAFFPEISYVKPGDTVTFVNMSGATREIEAEGGEWEVTALADGAEITFPIVEGMSNIYQTQVDAPADPEAGATEEDNLVIGKLNFSDAPALVTE